MAEEDQPSTLAEAYRLPVVTCRLVPRLDEPDADLDVAISLRRGGHSLSETMRISPREMRLPPNVRTVAENHGVLGVKLPAWVMAELAAGIATLPDDDPVWLQLGRPAGHLAAVSWEWHLAPVLGGRPLLRAPFSPIPPVISRGRLELAVCAMQGREDASYDLVKHATRVVRQMLECFPSDTRINLFTLDDEVRSELGSLAPSVEVHEPDGLPEEPEALAGDDRRESGVPGRLENPWLRWMVAAVHPKPIDLVHFVCPGYLSSSYGALDLGPAPVAELEDASIVTADQLMAFLNRAGTWGTAFTIPSSKAWPAGLRMLAHRVARLRPGPILVYAPYQARGKGSAGHLPAAYRALFTDQEVITPQSRGLCLYVHPHQVPLGESSAATASELGATLNERTEALTLLGSSVEALLSDGDAPAWLAANQRNLERWASAAFEIAPSGARSGAVTRGTADALAFVSEVLAERGPGGPT